MIGRLVVGGACLALLTAIAARAWFTMPLLDPVGPVAGEAALRFARAALEGRPPSPLVDEEAPQGGLPVLITAYVRGAPIARGEGRGTSFGAALRSATGSLRAELARPLPEGARLKLDRVIGLGRLASRLLPWSKLSAVPGRDGIGARVAGREAFLTADDLLRLDAWTSLRPEPVPDLVLGLDVQRAMSALATTLEQPSRKLHEGAFRFRAEEYVEDATRTHAIPIASMLPPAPELTRAALVRAASSAGQYLARQLDERGRYGYRYFAFEGRPLVGDEYSLARHAGTTSFLAQLYGVDHDPAIRAAAIRALAWLAAARPEGCRGPQACLGGDHALVDLGTSALGLVALLELERTTGEELHPQLRTGLSEFLLFMQKDDGDFCHLYEPRTRRRDERTQLPYFSGEAAYALALLRARETDAARKQRIDGALERAFTFLTETAYAHLAGQFYVGEDHWTCIALDAAYAYLPVDRRARHAAFCDEVAAFYLRSQLVADDPAVRAHPQLEGSYGLVAAVAPHRASAGSRGEALAAIWRLGVRRGRARDDARMQAVRRQQRDAVRFLLRRQLDDDSAYLMADPAAVRGALLSTDVEHEVRIDVVQHAGAALLGGLDLL